MTVPTWRVSAVDAVLLRMRLDSFVRMRFGPPAAARPQVPQHLWQWGHLLDAPDLAELIWNTYDDSLFPRAIGLRIVTTAREDPIYEIAEWLGLKDIRRSHWRFQPHKGWTPLTAKPPTPR